MKMNKHLLLALAIGASLAGHAYAQSDGVPARLRGKIDAVSGDTLNLTLRNSNKASAMLPATLRVTWITVAQPTDIAKGSYIGTAAIPQPDGTLKALEIQVFPPNMRGIGEGSRPFDLAPGSTMTNGTIGSMVSANGRTITITYKGGEKKVFVPDDVPFVSYAPADRSALTPGANVIVNGTRAPDGTVTATSVSVGQNGLIPPM
jgi:Domain of unknown function (DUF5666)